MRGLAVAGEVGEATLGQIGEIEAGRGPGQWCQERPSR